MSMQNSERQLPSDEIDLGELLLKLFKIVNRNKLILIIFTALGMAGGITRYYLKVPVYESSMMLRSDILTEAYSETLTDNLKRLIEERNDALLSEKLSITAEEASHLVDIKVESVEEANTPVGAVKNIIFLISVEITDNGILENLQAGIVNFLENNEFVKKRIDLRRKRFEALVSQVNKEIKEIDSLKKRMNEGIIYNQQGANLVVLDPSNVYEKALSLFKEELTYQENLELIDSIQLIEGFTAFKNPIAPKLSLSGGSGLLVGLFLALIIVFTRETISYLKSIDK